ncbi:MAG: hypothetical protein ACKVYV_12385, partial [Limisphaerales bacterium]
VTSCLKQMSDILGLDNLDEINDRTGHPYISLKILLSLYRRVKRLVDYNSRGQAFFKNQK